MKADRLYVVHIRECLERIDGYVTGGRSEFMTSILIQDAVLRNLQTLAESSQRVSDGCRSAHPEVPWRALSGFRNILVHGYLGVDLARVWQIVEEELPGLREQVDRMLRDLPPGD